MLNWLTSRRNTYILRWHHQPTWPKETLADHHMTTARIAYWLAVLCHTHVFATIGPDPYRCAMAGLFHDEVELITGDIPSSAKRVLTGAKEIVERWETEAIATLVADAPDAFKADFAQLMSQSNLSVWEREIVLYADKLSAYGYICDQAETNGSATVARIKAGTLAALRAHDYQWLEELRRSTDLP